MREVREGEGGGVWLSECTTKHNDGDSINPTFDVFFLRDVDFGSIIVVDNYSLNKTGVISQYRGILETREKKKFFTQFWSNFQHTFQRRRHIVTVVLLKLTCPITVSRSTGTDVDSCQMSQNFFFYREIRTNFSLNVRWTKTLMKTCSSLLPVHQELAC